MFRALFQALAMQAEIRKMGTLYLQSFQWLYEHWLMWWIPENFSDVLDYVRCHHLGHNSGMGRGIQIIEIKFPLNSVE